MSEAVRMPFWDRKALGLHAQIVADCAEDNDMVSLIASFKEMADLLGYKLTPRTELNAPPAVTEPTRRCIRGVAGANILTGETA